MSPKLRVALTRYPHTAPLVEGDVKPTGVDLEFEPITSIFPAFRRMARTLDFDVCELGISTAVQAKELGMPFTPLPVFVTRRFDYEDVYGVVDAGGLGGRRIGLRSYTVTDAVWSRGCLTDYFGFDPDASTYVVTGDEHLEAAPLPEGSELSPGADLSELLDKGEVDAILGRYQGTSERVRHLVPDRDATEARWIRETGFIPVHHTVVVRDDVLAANEGLAADLYSAFVAAKQPMLERLAAGEDIVTENDSPTGALHDFGVTDSASLIRPDPMPYGLEANARVLDRFLTYCHDQHLTSRLLRAEEVFAPVD